MVAMKKRSIFGIITIGAAILAGAGIFLYLRLTAATVYTGTLNLKVSSKVTVTRDSNGVPKIVCAGFDDLYFTLGYLHAMDRLNQISYARFLVNGNAESAIKDDGATINRLTLGAKFIPTASRILLALSDQDRKHIERYTDGINSYLETAKAPENYRVPWRAEEVVAVFLMKDWLQSFLYNRENIFQISVKARNTDMPELFPAQLTTYYSEPDAESIAMIRWFTSLARKIYGPLDRGYAMAVPGTLITDEKPLYLFGFMNSAVDYPAHYPVLATVGEYTFKGITVHGLPFIFGGENGHIRFFGFDLGGDTTDLIRLSIKNINNEAHYLTAGGYKKIERHKTRRSDRGINVTEFGPILNDIVGVGRYKDSVIAVASAEPGPEYITALLAIPRAMNIEEARTALAVSTSRPRAFLLADNDGAVRMYSGRLPLRQTPAEPFYPGDAYLPVETVNLSQFASPKETKIIAGTEYYEGLPAYYLQYFFPGDSRFPRLLQLVDKQTVISEKEAREIVLDKYSVHAEKLTALYSKILSMNPITSGKLAKIYFHNWDFMMTEESVPATLFNYISVNYIAQTLADELGPDLNDTLFHVKYLMDNLYPMAQKNRTRLFDNIETEAREDREKTFDAAFLQVLKLLNRSAGPYMENWTWGHNNAIPLPLTGTPDSLLRDIISRIPRSSIGGCFGAVKPIDAFINQKPYLFQGTTGYFGESMGSIHGKYSISTDGNSRFFYQSSRESDPYLDIYLHDVMETMVITPVKN